MNFNLTEGQLAIQKLAKDFSDREIEPEAEKLDKEGRLPDNLIKKFAGLGFLGMTVPKNYGGMETGNLDCILVIEQLAYSGTGAWWLVGFNNSIPLSIAKYGSEEIKNKYLEPFCSGTAYASIQFTEDGTGSDASALTTTAIPDGDSYIINGMKRFSTFGARPGYSVTYTKDDEGSCTAFVTEKLTEGYAAPKIWELMGSGGIEAADVYYDNYRVSAKNLLGKKGKGYDILLYWIATEKIEQCAACVGIAQAALDEAVQYAREREQFARKIVSFQAVQHMLADMATLVEAARALVYSVARFIDSNPKDYSKVSGMAKLFASDVAMKVSTDAVQILGGYGYMREYPVEKMMRDAKILQIFEGTNQIQRNVIGLALSKEYASRR